MGVNSTHDDFSKHEKIWQSIRDCIAGEEAVKEAGQTYLPALGGQGDTDYNAYKNRAMFYGATGRTLEGLLGALFRKPPILELPDVMEGLRENIDSAGTPFDVFSKNATKEVLAVGRYGVLTDSPETPQEGRATAYLAGYKTEQIVNWRTNIINGAEVLAQIILREASKTEGEDGFGEAEEDRYRVLQLDIEGKYFSQTYRKKVDKEEFEPDGDAVIPVIRGKPLTHIPFTVLGPQHLSMSVQKSPLVDLIAVNLSHYRTSADLEHGCHWTALPTPWVSGMDSQTEGDGKDQTLYIGSPFAWALPQGAQAGMLEFTGAGLESLEKRMDSKERLMVLLGARLLEDQKRAAEAAETKRIQQSGENSVMASIAGTIGLGLTQNLRWAADWAAADDSKVSVSINKDFFDNPLSPQEISALVAAWQQGALPIEALGHNLKEGEVLPPDMTVEAYLDALEQQGPVLGDIGNDNDEEGSLGNARGGK